MLLAAAAVAIVSPASIGFAGSPRTLSNVLSFVFSRAFLSRHNVAVLFAMLASAGIETSTDALDNLVCCTSYVTPHTSHLTQILPLWMIVVAAAGYD